MRCILLVCLVACAEQVPYSIETEASMVDRQVVVAVHGPPNAAFTVRHASHRRSEADGTLDANGNATARLPRWPSSSGDELEIYDPGDRSDTRVRHEVRIKLELQWDPETNALAATSGGRVAVRNGLLQTWGFPPDTQFSFGEQQETGVQAHLTLDPAALLRDLSLVAEENQELAQPLRIQLADGRAWEGQVQVTPPAVHSLIGRMVSGVADAPIALPERTGNGVVSVNGNGREIRTRIHGRVSSLADIAEVAKVRTVDRNVSNCEYEGGATVARNAVDYVVDVYDPRSGRRVAGTTIRGDRASVPQCPESLESVEASLRQQTGIRGRGRHDQLMAWLDRRVEE